MADYRTALTAAIAAGNLDAAVEVNMRYWLDGPHRESDQVTPGLRAQLARMQRDALINTRSVAAEWREEPLIDQIASQLKTVHATTLVLAGELDWPFVHQQARILTSHIPNAAMHFIQHTAHAPNFEQPRTFNEHVLPFLARP